MSAAASLPVLVTGAAGMLGSQLILDAPGGRAVLGTDLVEAPGVAVAALDLADEGAVRRLFTEHGPFSGVLHAAAYTAVDRAEAEPALARRINVLASTVLASCCADADVPLVAVGTDFVFDGNQDVPYTESDRPNPLGAYGRTKLEGERAVFEAHPAGASVVRTQWLYGPRGRHFLRTIAAAARERGELRVVDDQVGSPTSTLELAPAVWDVLTLGGRGVYHAACTGSCSWFELTRALLDELGLGEVRLEACSTEDFPRPAARPPYSVLDSSRLSALRGRPLAPWREALKSYLAVEAL